jgi:hypothetical protein
LQNSGAICVRHLPKRLCQWQDLHLFEGANDCEG